MTSQTGNILPNISRSNGNQKIKFGQFIEYNMINIFLEKSCTKSGGETSARPFFCQIKIQHVSGSTV